MSDLPICPVCGEACDEINSETEVLEAYSDGVGAPGDPNRFPLKLMSRTMVPGRMTTTYLPCGHPVIS